MDTGAAISLVLRHGTFLESDLKKSSWPVKFVTASGAVMPGGTTGLKLELTLPISGFPEQGIGRIGCEPVWAYEADLHSTDLIIGYPFLAGFGLAVDPGTSSLFISPGRKNCPTAGVGNPEKLDSSRIFGDKDRKLDVEISGTHSIPSTFQG